MVATWWMALSLVFSFFWGFIWGRHLGTLTGRQEGVALGAILLREEALANARCPLCGSRPSLVDGASMGGHSPLGVGRANITTSESDDQLLKIVDE